MRRHSRLTRLLSAYRENVDRHSRRYAYGVSCSAVRDREDALALTTVELLNTWNNFARAYWLSAFVEPRRANGAGYITCGNPILASDPLGAAIRHFRPNEQPKLDGTWDRRREPSWFDPNTLIQLTSWAQLSCAADVAAAFSINSRVLLDLPTLRNYFGHRNQHTRGAALRLAVLNSVPTPKRPSELLTAVPAQGRQPLFYEWTSDLDVVAEYICS